MLHFFSLSEARTRVCISTLFLVSYTIRYCLHSCRFERTPTLWVILFHGGRGKGVAASRVLKAYRRNSVPGTETGHPCAVLVREESQPITNSETASPAAATKHFSVSAFEIPTKNRSSVLGAEILFCGQGWSTVPDCFQLGSFLLPYCLVTLNLKLASKHSQSKSPSTKAHSRPQSGHRHWRSLGTTVQVLAPSAFLAPRAEH